MDILRQRRVKKRERARKVNNRKRNSFSKTKFMNNILLNSQHGLQSEKSLTITISSHARRENVFCRNRGDG